jgi:hypothetical protein
MKEKDSWNSTDQLTTLSSRDGNKNKVFIKIFCYKYHDILRNEIIGQFMSTKTLLEICITDLRHQDQRKKSYLSHLSRELWPLSLSFQTEASLNI